MTTKKSIALAAFVALLAGPAANLENYDVAAVNSLFESLWEKGSIKLDAKTGDIVVDEKLVNDLETMGSILVAGPREGEITSGICY